MLKDPVCGMQVKPESTKGTTEYKSEIYYFCTEYCKEEFERNPNKYLKKKNLISRFINWLGSGSSGEPRSCH
ncbi:MAG: YHS domain-containing protein [Elusimicrobiota bacterium]|nr:YHS domain-containing protein [Elusimicrobiota bacterium]